MKKYFVQTKHPDGEINLSVNTAEQIINFFGSRDFTGCEIEVFDGAVLGTLLPLIYMPAAHAPSNFLRFVNPVTREVEFEGFSTEH